MKIGSKTTKTKLSHELTRQEQNRRNNIKRLTVSAIVAIILFVALTIIQSSILNQEETVRVYKVVKDISEGTKITKDNIKEYFEIVDTKASFIPEGYITDASLLVDKFVNRNYKTKDVVTTDGLSDLAKLNISNITHPVQVSFSLADLQSSVSGAIREGDYVNIYGMRNGFNANGEVVVVTNDTYTFKHVYIERAYDSSGKEIDSADQESEAALFTVTIEEGDVALFNEMLTNCSIRVAKIMYETDKDYKAFINKGTTSNNNTTTPVVNGQTTDNNSNTTSNSNNTTTSNSTTTDNSNNTTVDPLQTLKDSMGTDETQSATAASKDKQ